MLENKKTVNVLFSIFMILSILSMVVYLTSDTCKVRDPCYDCQARGYVCFNPYLNIRNDTSMCQLECVNYGVY